MPGRFSTRFRLFYFIDFTEKQIEDLISENLRSEKGRDLLCKRGLHFIRGLDVFYRQLNLGDYGILDLVGLTYEPPSKTLRVVVIELKKGEININTLLQAIRYCKGLQEVVSKYSMAINVKFSIVLIGKTICTTDFCYMCDFIENLRCFTVELNLETGIYFNRERNYRIVDAKININESVVSSMYNMIKNHIREHVDLPELEDFPF